MESEYRIWPLEIDGFRVDSEAAYLRLMEFIGEVTLSIIWDDPINHHFVVYHPGGVPE
jgi:hypothetical protein